MKKIILSAICCIIISQISAQSPNVTNNTSAENNPYMVKGSVTATKTNGSNVTKNTSEVNKVTPTNVAIAPHLPVFETIVSEINSLISTTKGSTSLKGDKVKLQELAVKYEAMIFVELKENKSLTLTQRKDLLNQIIAIKEYK